MYLAAIETRANQRYVFSSNKLAEAAGASELIARVTSQWLRDALAEEGLGDGALLDENGEPRPEQARAEDDATVEVVVSSSGVTHLLSESRDILRRLISRVTTSALVQAPGLGVTAAISSPFDFASVPLGVPLGEVSTRIAGNRPSGVRFMRLPPTAECLSSGLPAAGRAAISAGATERRSHEAMAKRAVHRDRLPGLRRALGEDAPLPPNIGVIEELAPESWMAVVHADANRLGRLFGRLPERAQSDGNRRLVDDLRAGSLAVASACRRAVAEALTGAAAGRSHVPLLPLIMGGDDLLVVGEAGASFTFTTTYLEAFERATAATGEDGPGVARLRPDGRGLTAAAGLAVVKAHHPFAEAAELAYDTAKAAKGDRRHSRLDFVVAYGSASRHLEALRPRTTLRTWGRPVPRGGRARLGRDHGGSRPAASRDRSGHVCSRRAAGPSDAYVGPVTRIAGVSVRRRAGAGFLHQAHCSSITSGWRASWCDEGANSLSGACRLSPLIHRVSGGGWLWCRQLDRRVKRSSGRRVAELGG